MNFLNAVEQSGFQHMGPRVAVGLGISHDSLPAYGRIGIPRWRKHGDRFAVLGFSPAMPLEPMKKVLSRDVARLLGECVIGRRAGDDRRNQDAGESALLHQDRIHRACHDERAADCKPGLRRLGRYKLPVPGAGRILAGASLFFWVGAITAGRLTAYLFSHPG